MFPKYVMKILKAILFMLYVILAADRPKSIKEVFPETDT